MRSSTIATVGPAALTFVVDTSGSMDRDDRLGLVKESLSILVDELDDDDTVAIVTYDDDSGVVLEPTSVRERDDDPRRDRPAAARRIDEPRSRAPRGVRARRRRVSGATASTASCSHPTASPTSASPTPTQLARMIRDDADRGINLVTVGFGMGNFNDVTMEQLADQGDGFYAYVDTEDEAERLFEDELTSTLLTIAKDAKIQVEFDPDDRRFVPTDRLREPGRPRPDFRNDAIDAGELGAGHQVTAIYEIELGARASTSTTAATSARCSCGGRTPTTARSIEIDDDIDLRDIDEPLERHTRSTSGSRPSWPCSPS